jgi:peptidoglycan/xylan/chitin deacetylase (PgdA/CDA1 family)
LKEAGMSANIVRTAKHLARRIVGRPIFGRSILIYHRIANADFDPWNIAVSPDEFGRQLEKLRSKTVLPLREFARLHRQKILPRCAVAITFDDGYACNALVAAPILESFGYPATFFVVSDAIIRSEEFWWDQLEAIFHAPDFEYEAATRLLSCYSVNGPCEEPVGHERGPLASFLALWDLVRRLSTDQRRQYLDELRRQTGLERKTRPTHRPMTEAELRALAEKPLFEIGGHTATHPSLPTLLPGEQEQEIVVGSRFLETTLGRPIRSFAYPFGDWQPATRDIVQAAGFECAVTAEHRRVRPGDHQFELPRRQVVNRYARTL